MSLADELQKLQALREQGALTDEEFALAKKRLLEAEAAGAAAPPKRETPAPPPKPSSALRDFQRSRTDRWIGGVCGGLAVVTDIPAWSWRILFVLLGLLHGLGIVVYLLLWIFVPLERLALPAPAVAPAPTPSASPPADAPSPPPSSST